MPNPPRPVWPWPDDTCDNPPPAPQPVVWILSPDQNTLTLGDVILVADERAHGCGGCVFDDRPGSCSLMGRINPPAEFRGNTTYTTYTACINVERNDEGTVIWVPAGGREHEEEGYD